MTFTLKDIFKHISKTLREAKFESSNIEANIMLSHSLNLSIEKIFMNQNKKIYKKTVTKILKFLERRLNGEPLSYIVGYKYFFSIKFEIDKSVLIPRPETEILVNKSLKIIKKNNAKKILDVCCGSGCVGISLIKNIRNIKVDFSDVSKKALSICKKNIKKFRINKRCKTYANSYIGNRKEKYDLIVSNPPYVSIYEYEKLSKEIQDHEPKIALVSPDKGYKHLEKIIKQSTKSLNSGGYLAVEIGWKQSKKVVNFFQKYGFNDIVVDKDLNNINRVVSGIWKN